MLRRIFRDPFVIEMVMFYRVLSKVVDLTWLLQIEVETTMGRSRREPTVWHPEILLLVLHLVIVHLREGLFR